jgi:undecaprenyl-diphosphatase
MVLREAVRPLPLVRNSRVFLVVAALSAVVLLAFGFAYAGHTGPSAIDRRLGAWIYPLFRGNRDLARSIASLGDAPPIVAGTLLLACVEWRLRSRRGMVLAVMAPCVAIGLADVLLKPLFHRHFTGTGTAYLAYPSGHTTAVATVLATASVLALRRVVVGVARAVQFAFVAGCAAVVISVAFALVAAGYHFTTDTIGGAALALTTVTSLSFVIDAFMDRRRHRERALAV